MSRATYLSLEEMLAVVDDLHDADCPIDVIHIDAWMTGNVFRDFYDQLGGRPGSLSAGGGPTPCAIGGCESACGSTRVLKR